MLVEPLLPPRPAAVNGRPGVRGQGPDKVASSKIERSPRSVCMPARGAATPVQLPPRRRIAPTPPISDLWRTTLPGPWGGPRGPGRPETVDHSAGAFPGLARRTRGGGLMGHLVRTPAGTWRANWREPTGHQRAKTFRTKKEATAFLAQVQVDLRTG